MSKIIDALRRAEASKSSVSSAESNHEGDRPFRLITVASNKGGVGKTTVASNLAVYLRALHEDEAVLVLGLDDQTTLDRMFALDATPPTGNITDGLHSRHLGRVTRFGQYGVEYVPATRDLVGLREVLDDPTMLRQVLSNSERTGTVVIDTKSDFEKPTCAAILASDLTIIIVKDHASLVEAKRTFELLEKAGRPRESARILLSLVDKRVKYHEEENKDVLAHLLSQIRQEGYPVFQTFISRSPKVESLYTNPKGRAVAILQGAKQSTVHRQMVQLTREVNKALEANAESSPEFRQTPAAPTVPESESESAPKHSAPSSEPRNHATPPRPATPTANPPEPRPAAASRPKPTEPPRRGPGFWPGMRSKSDS